MDSSYSGSSEFYERYRHMSSRVGSFFVYLRRFESEFAGWVIFGRLFVEIMTKGTLWEGSTILRQDAGNSMRLCYGVFEDVL